MGAYFAQTLDQLKMIYVNLRQFTSLHFRFRSIYVNLRQSIFDLRQFAFDLRSIYVNLRNFTSNFGKIWLKNVPNDQMHVKKIQGRHFPRKKSPCGALHNIAQGCKKHNIRYLCN